MRKQWIAAVLAAALLGCATVPALASDSVTDALKKSLSKSAVKQTGETQQDGGTSAAAGAFTGSTPLAQYLYEKFSQNPSTLSVPVSLFSSAQTEQRFEELGQAAVEAYIQNGLTDYVEDFQYHYTSGQPDITMQIIYENQDTASRQAQAQALNRKAEEIVASVTQPGMSDRQKAEALNNYVAQNIRYDFEGFQKFQAGQNVYDLQTAYAGLVSGKAICQGFARSYKLLCDKAGIPCVVIFGTTKQFNTAHAWCRVQLDGRWETVDSSNPQLVINRVGSFCIPQDVVNATLLADGAKTLVSSKADLYLS